MKYKIITLAIILEICYIVFSFFVPIETQLGYINQFFSQSENSQKEDPGQAYKNNAINIINELPKSIIVSAILQNQYQGRILEIQQNTKTNTQYPLIIRLRGIENLDNSFLITKPQLETLQVFISQKNEKTSSTLNELKVGENVIIEEKLNLQKPWPETRMQISITIEK